MGYKFEKSNLSITRLLSFFVLPKFDLDLYKG